MKIPHFTWLLPWSEPLKSLLTCEKCITFPNNHVNSKPGNIYFGSFLFWNDSKFRKGKLRRKQCKLKNSKCSSALSFKIQININLAAKHRL